MSEAARLRTEFFRRLRPIRRRLRARQALAAVERAIPFATGVGIGLCAFRFVAGYPTAWNVAAAALAPLLVAVVWGSTRPIDWTLAARAVDQHYGLADRALSALANFRQFDRELVLSPTAELQVRDAVGCLEEIHARGVVELRMSRGDSVLAIALVLALVAAVAVPPEKLASGIPATAGQPDSGAGPPRIDAAPRVAEPSPFADLPAELLTQPAGLGHPGGPLALQQRKEESYLGDNAATERYFELMDRKSTSPGRPR